VLLFQLSTLSTTVSTSQQTTDNRQQTLYRHSGTGFESELKLRKAIMPIACKEKGQKAPRDCFQEMVICHHGFNQGTVGLLLILSLFMPDLWVLENTNDDADSVLFLILTFGYFV
jgi:hypothetical protein